MFKTATTHGDCWSFFITLHQYECWETVVAGEYVVKEVMAANQKDNEKYAISSVQVGWFSGNKGNACPDRLLAGEAVCQLGKMADSSIDAVSLFYRTF